MKSKFVFWSGSVLLVLGSMATYFLVGGLKVVPNQEQELQTSESIGVLSSDRQIGLSVQEQDSIDVYNQLMVSLPEYLNGTNLRGSFPIDENQELILHRKIKARFDYFFLMSSDLAHEEILAIIRGNIYSELSGKAQTQALEILSKYSDYLIRYNQLLTAYGRYSVDAMPKEDLQILLLDIQKLRNAVLGEELAHAFFQKEAWLQNRTINGVNTSEVPAPQYQTLQSHQTATLSFESTKSEQHKQLGPNPTKAQLSEYRVETYGVEAAQRLEQLDNKRADFKGHLARIETIRRSQQGNGLSDADNHAQLVSALKGAGLSSLEVKRLLVVSSMK